MQAKCETLNAFRRKLTVSTSAAEVDAAFAKAVRQVGKSAKIPGYRPGKAPRALLQRHYGAALQDAAQTALIDTTLQAAMQAEQIVPIARPNVQLGELEANKAFEYQCFVEVSPTIELGPLEGLEVKVPAAEDLGALLDKRLDALRREHAQIEPVEDRDTVGAQDVLTLHYEGSLEGKPFAGGSAREVQFDVENSGFIAGFAEGLIGAKVPSKRTLELSFPADYHVAELAGRPVSFAVELVEHKARRLPALDDEFAKDIGHDSLAALRQSTQAELEKEQAQQAKRVRERAVLQALCAANPVEVPTSMLDSQADRMVESRHAQIERYTGQKLPLDEGAKDAMRRELLGEAEFQVRSGLLLMEISRKLDLSVQEAEVDAEIERRVAEWPDQIEAARRALSTPSFREDLHYSLLEDKTVAYLLDHAKQIPA